MKYWLSGTALALIAVAAPARADVVSDWSELHTMVYEAAIEAGPAFDPSRMSALGRASLAMFEAANAVTPTYRSFIGTEPAPAGTSADAAIATAAHAVLTTIYPDHKKSLDDALTLSMASVPDGTGKGSGVALGKKIAEAVLQRGGWDEKATMSYYRPTGPAGRWAPSVVPHPPQMSVGKPWFMTRVDQFRIVEPPALTSAKWAESLNETKAKGSRDSKVRSPAETLEARFWMQYELDPVLRQIASQPGRSLVQNARMYALLGMASDDMELVMAEGKLHHMFWRPMNAIRTADTDGNDATEKDPAWLPLLNTPNQPEYPCGHCMFAHMTATILAAEGSPPTGGYAFTSDMLKGVRMTVPDMATYATKVSNSRIFAGAHFRFTNEVSDELGRQVARYSMARFAPPLQK